MQKHTFLTMVATVIVGAAPLLAAEGSRLSPPAELQQPAAPNLAAAKQPLLRPARVAIAEGDEAAIAPVRVGPKSSGKAEGAGRTRQSTVVAAPAPSKAAEHSSRRTAASTHTASHSITFRPVEAAVKDDPLPTPDRSKSPSRSLVDAYRTAKDDAVSGSKQPVIVAAPTPKSLVGKVPTPAWSDSTDSEETAKPTPTVVVEPKPRQTIAPTQTPATEEGLAPIVDAADLPRPSRVRRTSASEQLAPANVTWPTIIPAQPAATSPSVETEQPSTPKSSKKSADRKVRKEPGRLSGMFSGLTELLPLPKSKASKEE
jgi:hypothetical protein